MLTYINHLIEEKGLDLDYEFQIDGHINLRLENVIELILNSPPNIQAKMRKHLVHIDYKNGDVMDYFAWIAEGMAKGF